MASRSVFFRGATGETAPRGESARENAEELHEETPDEEQSVPVQETLVFNLSDIHLTPDEVKLLSRGLSYCPSERIDSFDVQVDLFKFFRTIRLKCLFSGRADGDTSTVPFNSKALGLREKSSFMPQNVEHAVETYVDIVEREMLNVYSRSHFTRASPNMSAMDFSILKILRSDPSIIIKPADKGGALVIMNSKDYMKEIQRQLSDSETYRRLDRDPTSEIVVRISTLVQDALENQIIDVGLSKFLIKQYPLTPVMYVLPKVHKSLITPPGRPIVSAVDSVFSPLSIFLDKVARPYLQRIASFILDTNEFLIKLCDITVRDSSILVSLDITSLYTSIQNTEGISAMKNALIELGFRDDQLQFLLDLLGYWVTASFYLMVCFTHRYGGLQWALM
uniref:Reverse transcriptase n=1 Tax=Leptobrachium leishanense TaxID=445787 RepID=A0A8C5M182_9ANUR